MKVVAPGTGFIKLSLVPSAIKVNSDIFKTYFVL